MLAHRREQLGVAAQPQRDAILHLEPGVLARRLHRVHHLARQALPPQLVVELQVERHRMRARALHPIALERLHRELDVVGRELVLLSVHREPDRPARPQRGRDRRRVQRRHRRRHLRHQLAEAGAERAVVRLELPAPQLVGLRDEPQPFHVQLLEHQVAKALDRLALAARGHHHRLRQRLAQLELCLRARRAAELDRLARDLHLPLEVLVAQRVVGLGVVAEVDRRLAAVEVLVDLVRGERDERSQQLAQVDEAAPQGPEGGGVAVPEAPSRQAHVPVREVVHEIGDRPPGARRVVVVEPLDGRAGQRLEPGERPAVQVGQPLRRSARVLDPVRVREQNEQPVGVPEREHELAHALADRLDGEAVAVPGLLRGEVVPAEGVRAVALDHVPRHHHVPGRLAHLLTLGVEDQPQAEHGAV